VINAVSCYPYIVLIKGNTVPYYKDQATGLFYCNQTAII